MTDDIKTALAQVANARRALLAHQNLHADAMRKADELITSVGEAESALKVLARESGSKRLAGSGLLVKVTYPQSRTIDANGLIRALPTVLRIPGVVKALDTKVIEQAVELGELKEEQIAPFRKVVAKTPAVKIVKDETAELNLDPDAI